ncbi:MAG: hypothetical protein AOA66_1766 [Candidatus Bathyarchaeota archaeon BA2]|nr:MAG: hypothetical protein AOA66_1766 [Candidatus Bathyarchaeota archaeon BA2]
MLECTCGWKGDDKEAAFVPVCPDCLTGHIKTFRILKRRDGKLQCPRCAWMGDPEEALREPECPKCANPYLKKV